MIRPFLVVFFFMISLIFAEAGITEKVYSHFDRLLLMREEALKDQNKRAIKNIDYVQKTEDGEFFEVDNERPPIETLVTKKSKAKQSKPLESTKDEDLLIEYYKKVNAYAQVYNQIKNDWIAGKIGDYVAGEHFQTLLKKYPNFSSSTRAVGIIYLSTGRTQEATGFFTKALQINERDPVALTAESITVFALGKKSDSHFYVNKAKEVDPTLFFLSSWELNYIQKVSPEIYKDWATFVDLRY